VSQASAIAARDEAIERCDKHADTAWKEAAFQAVVAVSRQLASFTADDVWHHLGTTEGTHEPAAMGPVFLRAQKAGLIEATKEMRQTRFSRRHRKLTVWVRKNERSPS
jgi:hypothetical protein